MLIDHDSATRDQAVTNIVAARKRKTRELRVFRVHRPNWQAEHLIDMISWCGQITEPPVDYQHLGSAPGTAQLPRHSQIVERCIMLVTEACQNVSDYENQHALIVSCQAARKGRKRSNTKAD